MPILPGDLSERDSIHEMIRVDQAGEYGAVQIYKGQLDATNDPNERQLIQHMLDQEKHHLSQFNDLLVQHKVRPTFLSPLWHVLGYTVGYVSAKLSKEMAMLCTVSVEEVIDKHYEDQETRLVESSGNSALTELVQKCRAEELEHKDIALEQGAQKVPGYPLISGLFKSGVRLAIALSKKI